MWSPFPPTNNIMQKFSRHYESEPDVHEETLSTQFQLGLDVHIPSNKFLSSLALNGSTIYYLPFLQILWMFKPKKKSCIRKVILHALHYTVM